MRSGSFLLFVLVAACCAACATSGPYVAPGSGGAAPTSEMASEAAYRVFLIGDAGAPAPDEPALRLLKAQLQAADPERSAVVFLGDNVYPAGLPDSADVGFDEARRRLTAQLDAVEGFGGRVVFVPGNHDWNDSRPEGLAAVRRQERFVEAYLDRGNAFLPDHGYPGPAELELADGLTLVALDTEWWLTEEERPLGETGDYDLEGEGDFLIQIHDVLRRRDDENVLVVAHHPLFSNGPHGGHFPLKEHLFPLTTKRSGLYVPLPVVGSLAPLYVRFFGGRQDLAHARYRSLRRSLLRLFEGHERLVYAAGHEHALQHFPKASPAGQQHYLVSGAGSKEGYVAPGRGAAFAYGGKGFLVIDYGDDGAAHLTAWAPEGEGTGGRRLYQTRLFGPIPERVDAELPAAGAELPDYRDSTAVQAANADYDRGLLTSLALGRGHRRAWATPVEVPVLDVARLHGGLEPVKRGGGAQTTSLRLRDEGGREYVLRSVDKVPARALREELRSTVVADVAQDLVSATHPYSALPVPALADAIGVYHTHPRIVAVPSDKRLGVYRETLAGELALFEVRPDEDVSDVEGFGGSENVIGSPKLYEEVQADNDHRVDGRAFLRARLLDLLIADWDRHRDQWRWASFEPYELDSTLTGEARTQGKVYRPVPRDRDFAFLRRGGPYFALARYLVPKLQSFAPNYQSILGLTTNGLAQDRRLLGELERDDWAAIAADVRVALADSVIDAAFRAWPEPIYQINGAEMARVLKARRDNLDEAAEAFYELLARVVDVVGSDKHERFEVTRLPGGDTEVVMLKTSKEGEVRKELYRRVFHPDETKEIRLYGLGGRDQFVVRGDVRRGLLVRAIGGPGEDRFVDVSDVRGFGEKTRFYDTDTGENAWEAGPETDVRRSGDPEVNHYDAGAYRHDRALPLVSFGGNATDGPFIGGGVHLVRHGFRKEPYAASHRVAARFAMRTSAFDVAYGGHFVSALGPWDVRLDAALVAPEGVRNFYGLGNETEDAAGDAAFYQARLRRLDVRPALARRLDPGLHFRIGPAFHYADVERDEGRFATQPQAGVSPGSFGRQVFAGLDAQLALEVVDDAVNPRQGFRLSAAADVNRGVRRTDDGYSRLTSELALYLSPSWEPQLTVAARVGGARTVGAFPFYDANTLGGEATLRGYRSDRFAGRSSFYANAELRLRLFEFASYLARGRLGALGFVDAGRVWTDGESSRVWHRGYGAGLWASVFDRTVVAGTLGFSEEGRLFTLGLGFFY